MILMLPYVIFGYWKHILELLYTYIYIYKQYIYILFLVHIIYPVLFS
jgi:hypothetical protein